MPQVAWVFVIVAAGAVTSSGPILVTPHHLSIAVAAISACLALISAQALAQLGPTAGAASSAPVSPGWLGVILETPADGAPGAIVDRVVPGSPAAEAGVRSGWHVVSVGGTSVRSVEEMIALVGSYGAGETVTLVLHDGSTADVRLGARPSSLEYAARQWVGEPMPALEVFALDGSGVTPVAAADATTVVEFWATWCGPCRTVAPRLHALDAAYGASLRVVAITDEPAADVSAWLGQNEAPGIVAIDPGGEAKDQMWVLALPTWFVVDTNGVVQAVVRGADDFADLETAIERTAGPVPAHASSPDGSPVRP